MKKFSLMLLLSIVACFNSQALELDYSNDHKIAAGARIGVAMYPSLDIELGVEYRPLRYIGANAALMYTLALDNIAVPLKAVPNTDDMLWKISSAKDLSYKFAARAGLQFTTPAIMLSKNEMGLSLRVSPGIIVPFPTNNNITIDNYQLVEQKTDNDIEAEDEDNSTGDLERKYVSSDDYKNKGAKFCYWYVRSELVLEFEEQWELSLGYTYGNFDMYGGSRNVMAYDTPLVEAKKKNLHSITLGLAFKF